ncbi:MAG: hypothetical protein ACI9ZF_000542 [Bradyrhizobium sp.]|jgi:hypothetical protein
MADMVHRAVVFITPEATSSALKKAAQQLSHKKQETNDGRQTR